MTERETHRERHRERDTERDTLTERTRQRERQRERGGRYICIQMNKRKTLILIVIQYLLVDSKKNIVKLHDA